MFKRLWGNFAWLLIGSVLIISPIGGCQQSYGDFCFHYDAVEFNEMAASAIANLDPIAAENIARNENFKRACTQQWALGDFCDMYTPVNLNAEAALAVITLDPSAAENIAANEDDNKICPHLVEGPLPRITIPR